MVLPIRDSIRILLLNDNNELLLMCADDPKTKSPNSTYNGRFWFTVGGEIESNETYQEAAIRELYEETGLKNNDVTLGPIVWFGEFDLILNGTLTLLKQRFIVATTKQNKVALTKLDKWEQKVIKKLDWFSLDKIKTHDEKIYPSSLIKHLPDILSKKYPSKPIEIDLAN